jgi:hypothetical protein
MPKSSPDTIFHDFTVGSLIRGLENVARVLTKAEKHAAKHGYEMANLMAARLYPDMFNLQQQLQYVCYLPVDLAQHFADKPPPRVGYDEATLDDFRKSIVTAIDYLSSIAPGRPAERAQNVVPTLFDAKRGMSARDYAAAMIMPDFYFHVTVAYAILRHNGVPLGKADFIGPLKTRAI